VSRCRAGLHPRRPIPATTVAYAALFLALGGSAYAGVAAIGSNDIKSNAIPSRHIKDGQVMSADIAQNAITSGKIANNAVTEADVNEQTLAEVPSAAHLDGLSSSAFFPAANVIKVDTTLAAGGQSTPLNVQDLKLHVSCLGSSSHSELDVTADATGVNGKIYWSDMTSDNGGPSSVTNSGSQSAFGILILFPQTETTSNTSGTVVYRDDSQTITSRSGPRSPIST
jgi:hypothetical protein